MTASGPAVGWPQLWALASHLLVMGVIGLVGGGWWALSRLDPLLAVPGLGWASAAMIAASRTVTPLRAGAIAATSAMLASLLLMAIADGAPVMVQAAMLIVISATVAAVASGLWFRLRRRLPAAPAWRRSAAALAAIILGSGIANLSPVLLDRLYDDPGGLERPKVRMITSLPLSGQPRDLADALHGRAQPQPAYAWLRQHSRLNLTDAVPDTPARRDELLLLAHPPALAPDQMVRIDAWVRTGGNAIILADGLSSWPPQHVIGDPRNPPVTSLLGPLLAHWGLVLDAPPDLVELALADMDHGQRLVLFSPGRLYAAPPGSQVDADRSVSCRLRARGHVAECRVGQGRALIVADADWLDSPYWGGAAPHAMRGWQAGNMIWLRDRIAELAGQPQSASHLVIRPVWYPGGE